MDHGRNERYSRIRARAGEIWLQEGCPANQHERHWLLALREIDREDADRKPLQRRIVRRPAKLAVAEPAAAVIRLPGRAQVTDTAPGRMPVARTL
nr:DUF2934 domain-containing protein [Mesorhizobium loti]